MSILNQFNLAIENWNLEDAQLFLDDLQFPAEERISAQQQLAERSALQEKLNDALRSAQSAEASNEIPSAIGSLAEVLSIEKHYLVQNHPDFPRLSAHRANLFSRIEQLYKDELSRVRETLDFAPETEINASLKQLSSDLSSLKSLNLTETADQVVKELEQEYQEIQKKSERKKHYQEKETVLATAIDSGNIDLANQTVSKLMADGYTISPALQERLDRLNSRLRLSDFSRLQSLQNSHDFLIAAMVANALEQLEKDEKIKKSYAESFEKNIRDHALEVQKKFNVALVELEKNLEQADLPNAEKYLTEANTLKEPPSASGLEERLANLGYKNIIMPNQDKYAPELSNVSLLKLEGLEQKLNKANIDFSQAHIYLEQARKLSSQKPSHQNLVNILNLYQDAQNCYPPYPNIKQLVDSAQQRLDRFRTEQLELKQQEVQAKSQLISEINHTSIQTILDQLSNDHYPPQFIAQLRETFDLYNQRYEVDKSQNKEFKELFTAQINQYLDLNQRDTQPVIRELTQFHSAWLEKITQTPSTNANAAKSQIDQLERKLHPIREQLEQLARAIQGGTIGRAELAIVDSLAGNDIILAFKPANAYRVLANIYLKNAQNNQISDEERTYSFTQAIRFAEISNDLALKGYTEQALQEFQRNSDYAEREAVFFDQIGNFTTSSAVEQALSEYKPVEIRERLSASKRIGQYIQQLRNQERERKVAQDFENATQFAQKGLFSKAVDILDASGGKEKQEFQKLHSQLKQVLVEESEEKNSLKAIDFDDFETAKSLVDFSSVIVLLKRLEALYQNLGSKTLQTYPKCSSDFEGYVVTLYEKWQGFKGKFTGEIETQLANLTARITREISTVVTDELSAQNENLLFADLERWSVFATDAQKSRLKAIKQNSNLWFSKNKTIKAAQRNFEQIKVSLKNLQEQYSQANIKFETLLQQKAETLIFQDPQLDTQKNELKAKKNALNFNNFSNDLKLKINSVRGLVMPQNQQASGEEIERILSQQIQDLNANMEREDLAHRLFLCDAHLGHIGYDDVMREINHLERSYKERANDYSEEWAKIWQKKQQSQGAPSNANTIKEKLKELREQFETWLSALCESQDLFNKDLETKHNGYLAKENDTEQFLNQIKLNHSKDEFREFWEIKQLHRSVLRCRDIDRDRGNDKKSENTSAKFNAIQSQWNSLKLFKTMNAVDRFKSWLEQRINILEAYSKFQEFWDKQKAFSLVPPKSPSEEATRLTTIQDAKTTTNSEIKQIKDVLSNYSKWKNGKTRNIILFFAVFVIAMLLCIGLFYGVYQGTRPTPTPTPITPTATFTPTFTPPPTYTPTPTNTLPPTPTPTPDFVRSCVSLNSGVPIRQLPDKGSEVVISIPNGQRVFVLLEKNNTQSGDYRRGWAFVRYITDGGSAVQGWAYFGGGNFDASCGNTPLIIPTTIPFDGDVIQPCIVIDNLSLRDQPSNSGQLLKSLTIGNPVLVLNSNSLDSTAFREGWIKVRYQTSGDTSIEGYIPFNTGNLESACSVNPLEP